MLVKINCSKLFTKCGVDQAFGTLPASSNNYLRIIIRPECYIVNPTGSRRSVIEPTSPGSTEKSLSLLLHRPGPGAAVENRHHQQHLESEQRERVRARGGQRCERQPISLTLTVTKIRRLNSKHSTGLGESLAKSPSYTVLCAV